MSGRKRRGTGSEVVGPRLILGDTEKAVLSSGGGSEKASMFAELGTTGIRRAGGIFFDHSTRDLKGGAASAKCFSEMHDFLPIVRASVLIYQLLIRQSSFQLQPPDDSPQALEYSDFAKLALDDMDTDFGDVVSDALSMLVYGWALQEEVYKVRRGPARGPLDATSKYSDGLVGWRRIALRAQRTIWKWELAPNGVAIGMWQLDPDARKQVLIPLSKALVFKTENAGGNPEGRSLLASSWKFWTVLKRLIEREAIGLGRDLTGIPVMTVPPALLSAGADSDQKATLAKTEKLVTGLTAHEQASVIIPAAFDANSNPLWTFKLAGVEGPARNFGAMNDTISRYEHRIATSMLTAFLMLGQDKVGTQALAENNSDMLLMAANAITDSIAAVFNRYSLPRLMRANGWPEELAPLMVPTEIKRAPTLKELGEYLTALSGIGAPLLGGGPDPTVEPLPEDDQLDDDIEPELDDEGNPVDPKPKPAAKPKKTRKPPGADALLDQLMARADLVSPTKEL